MAFWLNRTASPPGRFTSATQLSITGNRKYDYLIVRWDGKNGSDSIYYIANFTGTITIFDEPASINANKHPGSYDASSYWLADPPPVPEPATFIAAALLLLPLGASTLRILRKDRPL